MNNVVVVTLYIQYETMNEFWGVYKNKESAVISIKEFMEESNKESTREDSEDEREEWKLIKESDRRQVWQENNYGYQKEFYFQTWEI